MRVKVLTWPDCPSRFDGNGIALTLLELPQATTRADARMLAREVVKKISARLLHTSELIETPQGPRLAQNNIHVSLSYAADKALIGFSCKRPLGVDIVRIAHLPEIDALARLYLPTPTAASDADFAQAWAEMEACCKALNLPLAEIDEQRKKAYAGCDLLECMQIDGYRMAVALGPSPLPA